MATLVCTVELDKADGRGITVKIENTEANITQTITMDGTRITLNVQGASATSTITQDAEKISVRCKQFEVTAEETITLQSIRASIYKSADTLTVHSDAALTLSTNASADLKAAQKLAAEGGTEASLTGASASSLVLDGAGAALKGAPRINASAPEVQVQADAALELGANGPATLKGAIVNVQGNLVNLG
jgi:hypothetical protein